MTIKLLIDGDIVLYTSSSASEFSCNWGDDNWVLSANLEQAKDIATQYLDALKEKLGATEMLICLSDTENFRKGLSADYKSNRKGTRKPIIYNELKEWLTATYSTSSLPSLEADDLLGILATRHPESILVSPDKDMLGVPCNLYRDGELQKISLEQANRYHMLQTLTGDPTDGYKGCPGVGPVGANKLLQGPPEGHWEAVCKAYEKAGLTEEDALLNARLAYILRDENYQNGEVKLWTPSKV